MIQRACRAVANHWKRKTSSLNGLERRNRRKTAPHRRTGACSTALNPGQSSLQRCRQVGDRPELKACGKRLQALTFDSLNCCRLGKGADDFPELRAARCDTPTNSDDRQQSDTGRGKPQTPRPKPAIDRPVARQQERGSQGWATTRLCVSSPIDRQPAAAPSQRLLHHICCARPHIEQRDTRFRSKMGLACGSRQRRVAARSCFRLPGSCPLIVSIYGNVLYRT